MRRTPYGQRRAALDRAGWRCEQCERAGRLEVHHKRPLHKGGSHALDNLQVLCVSCHIELHRVHRTPEAWKRLIHGESHVET